MTSRFIAWFYDFYLRNRSKWWVAWFPIQMCILCGKPYWGGLPRWERWLGWTWIPSWNDYCSGECANEDVEFCDNVYRKQMIDDAEMKEIFYDALQPIEVCSCGSDAWGEYSERKLAFKCGACGKWKPVAELIEQQNEQD